jgi:phosphoglycolate phosphatase-like HAD superfamily hydrolase
MSPQPWLEHVVERKGVRDRFSRVDGLSGPTGGLKAEHLAAHVDDLEVEPGSVVVVGDTPDDADAALEVGTGVILYNGGSHHLPLLEGLGHPLAHSLVEAVVMAARLAHEE